MDDYGMPSRSKVAAARKPWWNPRYWSRRVWISVVILILVVIVVAVVGGVLGSRHSNSAGSYPDYSPLNYSLADTYSTESFFDNFNYFYGYDPAQGFVHYDNPGDAKARNLTGNLADGSVFLKVDTVETNATTGRHSVRLESKKTYNKGLFIFDVKHTPYGCGTWPALWLTDPSNWPAHGEIDVMEATNQGTSGNAMTLHTSSDCSMNVRRNMTGSVDQTDCNKDANSNAGCGVSGNSASFGPDWNKAGGGVLAVEWRDAGIRMWQFARSAVPADITGKAPTPQTWGIPAADFPNTDCNIGNHFQNNSIVANIDLCGDLQNGKNGAYAKSGCPSDCKTLVTSQPEAFINAYWNFGDFLVYQAS